MRLPGLDVIFSLAAPAVDILIEHTGVAGVEIGDDEACVGPVRASFDAGDDAFDAAPARGPVEELLEAAGRIRNKDRPWRGPCGAKPERRAGFQDGRWSTANTVRDRTAIDRTPF